MLCSQYAGYSGKFSYLGLKLCNTGTFIINYNSDYLARQCMAISGMGVVRLYLVACVHVCTCLIRVPAMRRYSIFQQWHNLLLLVVTSSWRSAVREVPEFSLFLLLFTERICLCWMLSFAVLFYISVG